MGRIRNKHFLLLLHILLLLSTALAQADGKGKKSGKLWSTPLIMVVYIVFFLVAAGLAFCIRHYRDRRSLMEHPRYQSQRRAAEGGLEAEEIESLPSLRYSEIKMNQIVKGKEQLECSVCLADFKDQEVVRILPDCLHVFHPHCIAPWLATHVTCPICRSSLEHRQGSSLSMSSIFDDGTSGHPSQRFDYSGDGDQVYEANDDDHVITVDIEESSPTSHSSQLNVGAVVTNSRMKLQRSYSTGDLTAHMIDRYSTTTRSSSIRSLLMPKEISPKNEHRKIFSKENSWSCFSPKSDSFVDYS